nr:HAD family phosphatase [uncultured Cetobacterium sp.]
MKNIVFDIGNVLLDFKPEKFLENLGFNQEKRERILEVVFKSEEWIELDRGGIDNDTALKSFIQIAPDLKDEIKLVLNSWPEMLTPIHENVQLLTDLKSKGYNIYYLSNFHKDAFEKVYSKYDFLRVGHGGIISYQINMLKPHKFMYVALLSKYNLDPSETLFIDDSFDNITGAKRVGLQCKLFTTSEDLKEFVNNQFQ